MNFAKPLGLILIGASVLAGCQKPPAAADVAADVTLPREAQPKLRTVKLWLGPETMAAEVASTERQITTGMMFRTNMAENDGMVFILANTEQTSFWMKNCFIPLSVAYIDPDGVIQEIHNLEPQNTNAVVAASDNIRFALETKQGWFERHNVKPGTVVRTERGSLMDTFVRKH